MPRDGYYSPGENIVKKCNVFSRNLTCKKVLYVVMSFLGLKKILLGLLVEIEYFDFIFSNMADEIPENSASQNL